MCPELTEEQIENALSGFQIKNEIDEGNIKRVFEAERNGERVALKVVPFEKGGRLEGYTKREIEIMRNIDSDIFVELLDAWKDEIAGTPVFIIVEEYLDGDILKKIINKGQTSAKLGINVTYALLNVLQKFESINTVHRDIKPENLKVYDSDIKLFDAGVARMNERETLTPDFKREGPGTTAYSAPEVLQNDRDNQNSRTDLFSTGIVLFEATTGEHPFNYPERSIGDAILEFDRKDLTGYIEDIDLERELDEFYKRLTEYQPAERYRKPAYAKEPLQEIVNQHIVN